MKTSFALAGMLLVTACAPSVDAPSLLPRPIEKTALVERPEPAAKCLDADREAAIASALEQARAADNEFTSALAGASTTAASGSEAWIEAQGARSQAEVVHGRVVDEIAKLDGRVQSLTNTGCDVTPYLDARTQIQTLADRESERLAVLSAR
jgi:hypothetical protein